VAEKYRNPEKKNNITKDFLKVMGTVVLAIVGIDFLQRH
jgi:hypothetical protein